METNRQSQKWLTQKEKTYILRHGFYEKGSLYPSCVFNICFYEYYDFWFDKFMWNWGVKKIIHLNKLIECVIVNTQK